MVYCMHVFAFVTLLTTITDPRTLAFPHDAVNQLSDETAQDETGVDLTTDNAVVTEGSPDNTEKNDANTLDTTLPQSTTQMATTEDSDSIDKNVDIDENIAGHLGSQDANATHAKIVQNSPNDPEDNDGRAQEPESNEDQPEESNTLLIICIIVIVILSVILCGLCICMYQIFSGIQIMH